MQIMSAHEISILVHSVRAKSSFGIVYKHGYYLVSGTQPFVFFLFRVYSIENEGLGNSFTFFVTFPGMLAVTAEHNE